MGALEQRCIVVDQRCRENEGKAKIEGYMSVSDEEAHHRISPGGQKQKQKQISVQILF